MNRYVALFILTAIALAGAARPAEAVIYGQTGPNGTFNTYQLISNDRSFDLARADASSRFHQGHQGNLASIGSAQENVFLSEIGIGANRWFGFTDLTVTSTHDNFNYASLGTSEAGNTSGQPYPPAGSEPGVGNRGLGWKWLDGTPVTFQNWNGGEPNNSGGEHGAHFGGTGTGWNDNKAGVTVANGPNANFKALVEYNTQVQQLYELQAWKATIVKVQDVQIPGPTVGNLTEARQVIAGTRPLPAGTPQLLQPTFNGGSPLTQAVSTVNFVNNAASAGFIAGDGQYPGLGVAPFTGDQNHFVIMATGSFTATATNTYTFGVNSDDGFALIIRDAGNNVVGFQDWSGQNNAASNDVNQTRIVNGELRFHNGRGASGDANANNVGS